MQANTKFERLPGKGALFAKADRDTGEIVKITGEFVTPEGVTIYLDGIALENGAISLTGRVKDHSRIPVLGLLEPQKYDPSYKLGVLEVGKKQYKINSKSKEDRNGLPFRFLWTTNNVVRAAF